MTPPDDLPTRPEEEEARGGGGLLEEHDAQHGRPERADAHPHGIGGADGQVARGDPQQAHAGDDGDDGEDTGHEPREALGLAHARREADLEEAGDKQHRPRPV